MYTFRAYITRASCCSAREVCPFDGLPCEYVESCDDVSALFFVCWYCFVLLLVFVLFGERLAGTLAIGVDGFVWDWGRAPAPVCTLGPTVWGGAFMRLQVRLRAARAVVACFEFLRVLLHA